MLNLSPLEVQGYLRSKNLRVRQRGHNKIEIERCIFCAGGESADKWTMVVYTDEGNFKCLRSKCGEAGTFWRIAEQFNDDPKEYFSRMEKTNGHKSNGSYQQGVAVAEVPRVKEFAFKSEQITPRPITQEVSEYLEKRGLVLEAVQSCKIFCDEQGNVCFPYFHKGEMCFVKARKARKPADGEQKAWAKWKGGLRTLWGIEDCDPLESQLTIVFGEYDRVALRQSGVPNAVSVPSGDEDLNWIDICWEEIQRYKTITLWTDNDESGRRVLPKIANRLGKKKIKFVSAPYKDANEMLLMLSREHGAETAQDAVFDAVAGAEWFWKGDLIQVADIGRKQVSYEGFLSGFNAIDKSLGGYLQGRATVHAGDSGHGKSTALGQSIISAIQQDGAVAVWSGEDDEFDFKLRLMIHFAGYQGTERRVNQRSGVEFSIVKDGYEQEFNKFVKDRLFLYNVRRGIDENSIFEQFDIAHHRYGCTVFAIDNLMKVVAAKDTNDKYQRQTNIVNLGCDFAKDTLTHLHYIAHTNKTGDPFEPPTKNSISGAKEITNLADNIIAWWRVPQKAKQNFNNADTLACILKNRVYGTESNHELIYDNRVNRFGEDAHELAKIYERKD